MLCQFTLELPIIVDLAVENQVVTPISTVERLIARSGQIDNAEAAMAKDDIATRPNAFSIGATMRDSIGHSLHKTLRLFETCEAHDPSNTAHPLWLSRV